MSSQSRAVTLAQEVLERSDDPILIELAQAILNR